MTLSDADRLIAIRDNEEQELTEWEEKFVKSCLTQLEKKNQESGLSPKQMAIVEKLEDIVKNGRKVQR